MEGSVQAVLKNKHKIKFHPRVAKILSKDEFMITVHPGT